MRFCHQCGYQLTLGIEKFCPNCGTDLQQQKTAAIGGRINSNNNNSIGIQHTGGDVLGTGISGSANIAAKDTKGNIYYFNIAGTSPEQLKNIITSSTTLDISQSVSTDNTHVKNLQKVTETKQQTGQVLEEISRIEKEEGKEIQGIEVGEMQISKNELSLNEIILKGNEHYYNKKYNEALRCYDKALELDPKNAKALYNKGLTLGGLGKYKEAIEECYDKALELDPKNAKALYNKGLTLGGLGKYKEAMEYFDKVLEIDPKNAKALYNKGLALKLIDMSEPKWYTSDGKPVYE